MNKWRYINLQHFLNEVLKIQKYVGNKLLKIQNSKICWKKININGKILKNNEKST